MNLVGRRKGPACLAILGAVCGLVFFLFIGSSPFHDKGEPREALVVRDIVLNGNWLFPLRLGQQIPSKPPFFHWVGALTSRIRGHMTEATIRFPSAFFASFGVFLVYYLGKGLYDPDVGLTAGLMLATTAVYHSLGLEARVDMTLTFFVTLPLVLFYCLYRGLLRHEAWWYLFFLSVGVGVTAKGPVSLILCALVISLFLASQKKWEVLGKFSRHPGVILAGVACFSWYAAALYMGGDEFIGRQFFKENLARFFAHGEGGTGHQKPVYFFIPYFFILGLPWTIYLPIIVWYFFKNRIYFDERVIFLSLWVAVVLVFFSLSAGKRPPYILPLYPPLVLLIAISLRLFEEDTNAPSLMVKIIGSLAFAVGVLLILLLAGRVISGELFWLMTLFRVHFEKAIATEFILVQQALEGMGWMMPVVLMITASFWLLAGWNAWRFRIRASVLCVTASSLIAIVTAQGAVNPVLAAARSYKDFVDRAVQRIGRDRPLVIFPEGLDVSSIAFYGGKEVKLLPVNYGALRQQLENSPDLVIVGMKQWKQFTSHSRFFLPIIDQSYGAGPDGDTLLVLVRGKAAD